MKARKKWESYEQVAAHLIHEFREKFGFADVQGKQKIQGQRSGAVYEIDGKGVRQGNEGFVIIECRRYTKSRQNQEKLGGLAYRIIDTGAAGGIIVSPLGLQEGALKIANAENILNLFLTQSSTPSNYVLRFLHQLMIGVTEEAPIGLHEHASVEILPPKSE